MQKHEGPREPRKPSETDRQRTTANRLLVVIAVLCALIAVTLLGRMAGS